MWMIEFVQAECNGYGRERTIRNYTSKAPAWSVTVTTIYAEMVEGGGDSILYSTFY